MPKAQPPRAEVWLPRTVLLPLTATAPQKGGFQSREYVLKHCCLDKGRGCFPGWVLRELGVHKQLVEWPLAFGF